MCARDGRVLAPFASRYAGHAMACAVDHLAAGAAIDLLRRGGTAADAAVGASAVLAVTSQHMCGMGGDLFALVAQDGEDPAALNASGRAGSGADPDRLRTEGQVRMAATGDIRAVPIPGCVDGWLALHGRYGRLPLSEVLGAAIEYAGGGFPASPTLVLSARELGHLPGAEDFGAARVAGALVRRPGIARALEHLAADGRNGFYCGEFGVGMRRLGGGEYTADDLARCQADWVSPIGVNVWGHRLWSVPPNSQGYLVLAAAAVAAQLPLPRDPDDPLWAHLTIEAVRAVSADREVVLSERADPASLLAPERLAAQAALIDPARAASLGDAYRPGGTIYLCVVDADRCAVSLIQSNAAGFGSRIVEPTTGVFLQNRGIGFSLQKGHPAEYGPGRRPPSTLSPALLTHPNGGLAAVLGTMGGDSQPQILLQLLTRLLINGESVGQAVSAPRWVLSEPGGRPTFYTWSRRGTVGVHLETGAPSGWCSGLADRGHRVEPAGAVGWNGYGHAHVIRVGEDGVLEGASDPRSLAGAAAGW